MSALSPRAMHSLQRMFLDASGIRLPDSKRALIEARLRGRLEALELPSFDAYCALLERERGAERKLAIELLTTNETYFFREPDHFQMVRKLAQGRFAGAPLRIWSAACSSGEEAYSLAMTMSDARPAGSFEIKASDLSSRMLERARLGVYPMQRLEQMPPGYLKRFALRGSGRYEGMLRVSKPLREGVDFFEHNLLRSAPAVGKVHILFLRNALIYFDAAAKQCIVEALLARLVPQGVLFVSHSESLQGLSLPLRWIGPGCYEHRRGDDG